MTLMSPREKYRSIQSEIGRSILKPRGYQRRGSTFSLQSDGNWGLINFQSSMSSTDTCIIFTLNVGICSGRIQEFGSDGKIKSPPSTWDCQWSTRIGHLMPDNEDIWWSIDEQTDLEIMTTMISQNVSLFAIPQIDAMISDEALRDRWMQGVSPGLTKTARLLNLAVLLKCIGPQETLPAILEELRATTTGKPSESMVRDTVDKLLTWSPAQ